MCKEKYRCSFKYYISQGLLLFVNPNYNICPLNIALGSQCILVCSYEMFLEKTGCVTTEPDGLFCNAKRVPI